jgi:hypothetical protein
LKLLCNCYLTILLPCSCFRFFFFNTSSRFLLSLPQ